MHKRPSPKIEAGNGLESDFLALTGQEQILRMYREMQELRHRLLAAEAALTTQELPEVLEMPRGPVRRIRTTVKSIDSRPFVYVDEEAMPESQEAS